MLVENFVKIKQNSLYVFVKISVILYTLYMYMCMLCMNVSMYVQYVCMYVCTYICILCMYVCMYVCILCMHVCMYVYYVCMYVCQANCIVCHLISFLPNLWPLLHICQQKHNRCEYKSLNVWSIGSHQSHTQTNLFHTIPTRQPTSYTTRPFKGLSHQAT